MGAAVNIGKYTVRLGLRVDNPAWPVFLVFVGDVLIGKSFSSVDLSACQWLERQQRDQTFYAYSSAKLPELSGIRRSSKHAPRNRKVGVPRKPETIRDIAKALAGG